MCMHVCPFLVCSVFNLFMGVHVCMWVHMFGDQRLTLGVLLGGYSPYFLRQSLLLNLEFIDLVRLAGE